jgi:hypothetical protein
MSFQRNTKIAQQFPIPVVSPPLAYQQPVLPQYHQKVNQQVYVPPTGYQQQPIKNFQVAHEYGEAKI